MVRNANIQDAPAIADIYNHYILNSVATFEKGPVSSTEMGRRIETVLKGLPFLIFVNDGKVLGYAYAIQWRKREAYKQSTEVSVYLNPNELGKGVGTDLYAELFKRLKVLNVHAVIGGVSLPNAASVKLHEKFGFEKVAHFKEVGFKFDTWVDVGYWEMIL